MQVFGAGMREREIRGKSASIDLLKKNFTWNEHILQSDGHQGDLKWEQRSYKIKGMGLERAGLEEKSGKGWNRNSI